nr:uncharacterized protein LOC128702453 isoform X2 [Cherax quadricarinatus]
MKPLKTQVSFSKERNFSFQRKADSFRGKGDIEGEKNKCKDKKGDIEGEKNRCKDKKGEGHQLTSAIASSLAATLSPFSNFVASHSPRGSRKPSPSPVDSRKSSPPSPRAQKSQQQPRLFPRTNSFTHRHIPLLSHSKGRTNSFNVPSTLPRGTSSSPNPPSSPSLSPTTSRSQSSSSAEDYVTDEDNHLYNVPNFDGCRPKIRVSSDDNEGGDEEGSGAEEEEEEEEEGEERQLTVPRVLPYRIEEGWQTRHSTDTVAKHRKTCQSCKCTRELHDVYHEDWVNVRERLGLGDTLG